MRADPSDSATSAFAGLPAAAGRGRGVIASEREGLGIARIAARRAQAPGLTELFEFHFGLEPPNAPRRAGRGDVAIAGIGPDTWIATRENAGHDFAQSLQSLLGHSASVVDQSDAYVMLRLAGPRVREAMAKLVPIDVHERSFRVGDVAQTVCGYINLMLWRLEDTAQSDPAFELWAARSLAVSLYQAICHSAAEFGFVREPTVSPASTGRQTA